MKPKPTEDEEQETESMAFHINKLLYYKALILSTVSLLLIIGVAVFKNYSLRQPMLYMALAGIAVLVAERITTWKLQRQDVV